MPPASLSGSLLSTAVISMFALPTVNARRAEIEPREQGRIDHRAERPAAPRDGAASGWPVERDAP